MIHINLIRPILMIAASVLFILAFVVGLVALVLHIMVLVKLFKHGGVGLGILGLFCGIFTFIWGWVKATELGLKKTMLWLTLTLVISTVLYMAGSAAMLTSPEVQAQMKKAMEEAQKAQQQALPAPQ